MDTLLFGALLAAALFIIFARKRWIAATGFVVCFVAIALLFAHHVTSTLELSF
ncbi:MAG: DUF5993 family protein [Microbacteriaceae bacterium]|jgi:hypothetical protein